MFNLGNILQPARYVISTPASVLSFVIPKKIDVTACLHKKKKVFFTRNNVSIATFSVRLTYGRISQK